MTLCKKVCFGVTIAIGVAMVIIGGVVLGVFPGIMDKKIKEGLSLTPNSDATERFANPPVASYMSFYMFSVTNKDDVNNGSAAAILEQKGPYVYRQEKLKFNLTWYEDNGTLYYEENTKYFFEPSMTKGDLSDKINHINMFPIGIRYNKMVDFLPFLCGAGTIDKFMENFKDPLILTHTVDELLFAGYPTFVGTPTSPCLNSLKVMCESGSGPCKLSGYFLGRNNTNSAAYQIYTGINGMDNYAEIVSYGGQSVLDYWEAPSCNAINGTDGKQYPPGVEKERPVYAFSTDICRSMKFDYREEVTIQKIDALRYVVPEYVFEDPNIDESNMCFCGDKPKDGPCPSKKGVISIKKCQEDKPIAISSPHFYFAEEEYKKAVGGMDPRKEKHETYLDIEPLTGTVIAGAKRLQMNLILQPYAHLDMLSSIQNLTYFPMFWAEEGASIDEKTAQEFRDKVTNPYKAGKWGSIAVLILGCVVLLLVIVIAVFQGCKK